MKLAKAILCVLIVSLMLNMAIPMTAAESTNSPPGLSIEPLDPSEYVPGELLIKFVDGIDPATSHRVAREVRAQNIKTFSEIEVQHWQLGNGISVEQALKRLSNPAFRDVIEYAEPNYVIHGNQWPNDALRNELYGLHNIGQTGGVLDADIDALEAWDNGYTGSSSVVIAVIDSGIDYNHEDLAGNIWTNPNEIPDNEIDDDGNGFVDDVHGWDFVNNDNDPMDDNGHGTHCAGTIGAMGNNGIGVTGVSWSVQLMPIKFLNAGASGSTANAINAINYAASFEDGSGNKIVRITSNSYGGGHKSKSEENAIKDSGALFVAAAGNSGNNRKNYPAGYALDNIISVAATDHVDGLWSSSSYGSDWVDLGAPGVDILSTVPGDDYESWTGTSMACPHVSGVAALLLADDPNLTIAELKDQILNTVDLLPSLSGKCVTGGRLNARAALVAPELPEDTTAPSAVTDLGVDTGATTIDSITIIWSAPGDDGSTGTAYLYDIRYLPNEALSESNWASALMAQIEPIPQVASSAETFTLTNLLPETTYYIGIKTADEAGNYAALSNIVSETTNSPPIGEWTTVLVDTEGDVGRTASIAIDSNGFPHISYLDVSNGRLKYARWTGSEWLIETVPNSQVDTSSWSRTSIALDSSDQPRIAYAGGGAPSTWLMYAKKTGTGWELEQVDAQASGVGTYASLALDANDNPHISHWKHWGKEALRYAHWDGARWNLETVDRGDGIGTYSSIAIDIAGNPHISYSGGHAAGGGPLKYAVWSGSSWSIEIVDPDYARATSLELDSSGNPHVSYIGAGSLRYAYNTGTQWEYQVVDAGSYPEKYFDKSSLELDEADNPCITYSDTPPLDQKYAQYNGVSWDIEVVESIGDVGYGSLALDDMGNPHISYYDTTNGDLKYAYKP